jgi:hypothetical protein
VASDGKRAPHKCRCGHLIEPSVPAPAPALGHRLSGQAHGSDTYRPMYRRTSHVARTLADFDGLPSAPSTVRTYIILLRMDEIVRHAGARWLRTPSRPRGRDREEVLLIFTLTFAKGQLISGDAARDRRSGQPRRACHRPGRRALQKGSANGANAVREPPHRRCRARAGHAIQAASTQNL